MAKYCGKCGLPLNADGQCRLCDEMEPARDALETDEAVPLLTGDYMAPPPQAAPAAPVTTPPAAAKKKSPLVPVMIIIILLLALAGGAFAAFHFHLFGLGQTPEQASPATSTSTAVSTTAPLPSGTPDSATA